jgi:AAA family ATP:ADP antiporter
VKYTKAVAKGTGGEGGVSGRTLALRASFLFINFFLIITGYYQVKPASRSLFIEYLGADYLPYVWIGTAVVLGGAISFYHRWVARYPRDGVVFATCLTVIAALVLFRLLMISPGPGVAVAFYIFVDIFSVVLVEQFWSLSNSLYGTDTGRRWYGLVGTGGLVGGVAGGAIATSLIRFTPLQTPDLLLVAAVIIALILGLTRTMSKWGLYREGATQERPQDGGATAGAGLFDRRYLILIAATLFLAQLAEPVVEFQFLKSVEAVYTDREARTAFLSLFLSVLGLVSIGINLVLTPLVHRVLGVIAGLLVQPVALGCFSGAFIGFPSLMLASAMKISDRGLSYSINRASKELLYVPIRAVLIYQAKAWIDMLGYRVFKVAGSVLILLFTQWLPWVASVEQLGWLTLTICVVWCLIVIRLQYHYRHLARAGSVFAHGAVQGGS